MSRLASTLLVVALLGVASSGVPDLEHVDLGAILSSLESMQGPSLQAAYNRGLDFVLAFINRETVKRDKSDLDLPSIEEHFSKKVWFVMVRGTFVADGGVIGDLATVRRMGETSVEREGDAYTVTLVVGLGAVQLRYGHYVAKLGRRGPSVAGHLDGQVGNNAIRASATVSLRGANCSVVLNEVKVVNLEGLHINVRGSGFGPLNWLLTKFANSFADNNREEIIAKLEEGLSKLATSSLSKIRCGGDPEV